MNLVVILSRVPWPLDKGDKLRAYHQIRMLAQNHSIELIALNDTDLHPDAKQELSKYCKKIHIIPLSKTGVFINLIKALFSGKPLQIGYFYSSSAYSKINNILANAQADHIYGQLVRVAEYMRKRSIPTTLDYQDALSEGIRKRKVKAKGIKRLVFALEYKRLLKYETRMMDCFNNTTIITAQDRDLIQHADNEKITVVPNGVDMEFFHPMEKEKIYDVVFTGNMNYPPNIMAAKYLAIDILPIVQKQYPKAKLLIAGASPHPSVRALASEWVSVSGWVDDIRTAYASSKVFVAPMQIGTGLQNKLLEAMAMKIPSVTSDMANSALNAKRDVEIKVAQPQDKEAFAKHILHLLSDQQAAKQQAQAAHKFVREHYSWRASVDILEQLFSK